MKTGIRFKTILTFFPVILASLTFIGASALFTARSGMIRIAMENLSFKAELLQQHADSQWKLLESQGYSQDPEFRKAMGLSIETYAKSLLRDESEWISAFNLNGDMEFSAGRAPKDETSLKDTMLLGTTGPIRFGTGDTERYGQAFYFDPLVWYLVVSKTSTSIFAETDTLTITILTAFIITLSIALLLLILLTGSIVKPILRVSEGMTEIMRTHGFNTRLPVTSNDEVGSLTGHFNTLCGELDRSYTRIREIAQREVLARYEISEREFQTIIALGKVAEYRDEDTVSHTIRVGLYSRILADLFFHNEEEKRSIFYAAPLHDIGKIGIPDSILLKPAALTPEEFEFIKSHTTIGFSILKEFKNPALAMGAVIALSHHERFNGTGYPKGLAGEEIPLSGRILAIVDVFDAMTSERPYKKAWPPEKAFDYIYEQRSLHFDPLIAQAFLDHKDEVLNILKRHN